MIAPDDGLEAALRQALSSAAGQVEPGDCGLERILVRTGRTPPRSWLSSVAEEALRRLRHWTWRGHWAWQAPRFWSSDAGRPMLVKVAKVAWTVRLVGGDVLRQLAAGWRRLGLAFRPSAAEPRGLRRTRLAAGLAAAAFVTAVAVAVPPLRAALVQVSSTMLTGGNEALPPGTGGAGGPGGPNGTGHRAPTTAVANGSHKVRPSGSPGAHGTGPASGTQPGSTVSSRVPCAAPSTGSGGSTGGPSASPSAQPSSSPVSGASVTPFISTSPTRQGCPDGQPTQPPATPTPATPAPPVTTDPVAAPTTVPPSSDAPAPADSTPPPSPTPGAGPSGSGSSGSGSSGTDSGGISGVAPANQGAAGNDDTMSSAAPTVVTSGQTG